MPKTTLSDRFNKQSDNVKGSLILIVAAALFTIMVALIKQLGSNLHVTQIVLIRQIVMTIIIAPTVISGFPGVLRTNRLHLHITRMLFAVSAMLFGFTSIIHLPLADATSLGFAKSFFISIFAVFILKEYVGPRRWTAVAVGFFGVMIMMKPGTESFSVYGFMALAAAASAGMAMVLIRFLSRSESTGTILAWQAIGVGILMLAPAIWFWKWPTNNEWILLLCMGAIAYLTQRSNILAYKLGEASLLASLDYIRLLFATLIGYLAFSTLPGLYTWIGSGIIVAAAIYTIWREAKKKQELTRSAEGSGYIQ